MRVDWLCRQDDLDCFEWVKLGCVRLDSEAELSEWSMPSWAGAQQTLPSSLRSARMKVRTAGGSDGGGGLRVQSQRSSITSEKAGQLVAIERRFSSEPSHFCELLEQRLGKAAVEPDGTFVWKPPGSEARVIMYRDDRRVKVVGRPNQVRSLVVIVAPYTEALTSLGLAGSWPHGPAAEQAAAAARKQSSENGDSGAADVLLPGAVGGGAGDCLGQMVGAGAVWQYRVATLLFEPQDPTELKLEPGAVVCVTLDPDANCGAGGAPEDRWVYGCDKASGCSGWFPLSHTVPSAAVA